MKNKIVKNAIIAIEEGKVKTKSEVNKSMEDAFASFRKEAPSFMGETAKEKL